MYIICQFVISYSMLFILFMMIFHNAQCQQLQYRELENMGHLSRRTNELLKGNEKDDTGTSMTSNRSNRKKDEKGSGAKTPVNDDTRKRGKHTKETNTKKPKKDIGRDAKREQTYTKKVDIQLQVVGEEENLGAYIEDEDFDGHNLLKSFVIKKQIEHIMASFPRVNATVEVIGRTAQYNDIVLVKAAAKDDDGKRFRADENKYEEENKEKKIIFIAHGLNVMGMVSNFALKYIGYLKKILSYYFAHLNKFDIFLIPMANPDGYESDIDCWSKNMSPQTGCPGVHVDRNFDVAWNTSSNIANSCHQHYQGAYSFSESESVAIRDVFHRYSHKMMAYIHVHSSTCHERTFKGDAVLYPKGFSDVATSDDDKYTDIKGAIDEVTRMGLQNRYSVTVDTLHHWYGLVSGTSVDYASTVYGIPYAMEFAIQAFPQSDNMILFQLWKNIIDVTFTSIYKSIKVNDEEADNK